MIQNTTAVSKLLKTTRQYFWDLDFTEVEVNYLNPSLPLEPNLYSYRIKDWYLPTSPEFALKQFLAQNHTHCFSIAHCFRDLESTSPQHLPEFLMLEYYLVNQNLTDLQESLKQYLNNFIKINYQSLQLPPTNFNTEPEFNQWFLNEIESTLPKDKAVFITGYPAFLSPLAKPEQDEADVFVGADPCVRSTLQTASRFELYINGIEIANGCEENRDISQIEHAFKTEARYRRDHNLPTHPISSDFLDHCAALPSCSGVGIGLNRLLSLI